MLKRLLKPRMALKLICAIAIGVSCVSFAHHSLAQEAVEATTPPPDVFLDVTAGQASAGNDLFYDSEALLPPVAQPQSPPKAVKREKTSKMIVVRENYGAGTQQAKRISAERAMTLGRYDSALTIYNELYAVNKSDPNILLGRATALQQTGNDERAVQAYEELLDLRPENVEAQVNMLGLLSKRYPAVALRRLVNLGEQYPSHIGVIAQTAVVQAQIGHYDEAVRYLGMAASIEPQNPNHIYNMAVIADRSGAKKDAVKYYEQALEVDTIYGGGRTIPREAVFERLARLR